MPSPRRMARRMSCVLALFTLYTTNALLPQTGALRGSHRVSRTGGGVRAYDPEETRDSEEFIPLHGADGSPPTVRLGDFVVQRAIQQQLYFIAELKNEPVQTWLAKFQGHEHLESVGRKPGAPGNPGSYSAEFGQLRTTPYTAYLSALGDAPDDVVKVEYTAPRRKLSVRAAESNPHHSP